MIKDDDEKWEMEYIWNWKWNIYETTSNLSTITQTVISIIDSNWVLSFSDNSIITLIFLTYKKEKKEVNDNISWLSLAHIISRTNIINIGLDRKKLGSL